MPPDGAGPASAEGLGGGARIHRMGPGDGPLVLGARHLFDHPPDPAATARFLAAPGHHLFLAFVEDVAAGFVSGVEMTHPDKGTEMFLYELAVDPAFRRRGYGRALVQALAATARDRGCYGMWVLTDDDDAAALRTYQSAGGRPARLSRMLAWEW